MAIFGTQLSEAAAGLAGDAPSKSRVVMQIVVSLVAIAAGIFIILSHSYSDATQKLASGWVGLVLGYWLK